MRSCPKSSIRVSGYEHTDVNKVFPSFSFFLEFMIMFSFKSLMKRKNGAHKNPSGVLQSFG